MKANKCQSKTMRIYTRKKEEDLNRFKVHRLLCTLRYLTAKIRMTRQIGLIKSKERVRKVKTQIFFDWLETGFNYG